MEREHHITEPEESPEGFYYWLGRLIDSADPEPTDEEEARLFRELGEEG